MVAKKHEKTIAGAEFQQASPVFSKTQFLTSKRLAPGQKDMASVVLIDGTWYSEEEVNKALSQFMKRSVQ